MDISRLNYWLNKRKNINDNDSHSLCKCWNNISEILSVNEKDTILYLKSCNKENLFFISEVFDDISYNLKSKNLICVLEELNQKYPELNMEADIICAKSYIEYS